MKQRHKHADVIIAWAEGKDVQVWDYTTNKWGDIPGTPAWCEEWKYRIKPPAKKYRMALFHRHIISESLVVACNTSRVAEKYESLPDFVRWLTDWIEYEE